MLVIFLLFEINIVVWKIKTKSNTIKSMHFFYLLLFIVLVSCSSLKKSKAPFSSKPININQEDITLFEEAFKSLGDEKYSAVIPIFSTLATKYRGHDLERAALYNLASAYKELHQCKKAETIYQNLITKAEKQPHLKPRIYLSLSYVYECLGRAEEALIALKDGMPYIHYLTKDIQLIEYPARLSLAYIRLDEDKKGLKIQKKVYQNLEMIKKTFRISSAADESFARYFYIIGRSHIRSDHIQISIFLKMFSYHQAYLTQSILLKAGKWSIQSEKELGNLYRKMWTELKKQKEKKIYRDQIRKLLNQLKSIARTSKSKKMENIYLNLRKKTTLHLR